MQRAAQLIKTRRGTAAIVAALTVVAAALRLHAYSPYLPYPDAYQTLLVARNFATAHQAVATLGNGGITFPHTFDWTRPLYPALVAFVHLFGANLITAGHIVAIIASIAAVPVAYWAITNATASRRAGVAAAGLLAVSYAATIWSGFVLTEPLANLVLLLGIGVMFGQNPWLTGIMWGLAALTRYEYAILILPVIAVSQPLRLSAAAKTVAAWAAVIIAGLLATRSLSALGWSALIHGTHSFVPLAVVTAAALVAGRLAPRYLPLRSSFANAVGVAVVAFVVLVATHSRWSGLRSFAAGDSLLTVLALCGFVVMARVTVHRRAVSFAFISTIVLAAVYVRVNPTMERYGTHLIPLLLIPAGYAVAVMSRRIPAWRNRVRIPFALVATALVAIQITASVEGFGIDPASPWTKPSYEATAAQRTAGLIPPGALVITALPEPYAYFTGHSTQTVSNAYPFIVAHIMDNQYVVVVQDEAMRRLFPHFSSGMETSLSAYRVTSFTVNEPFTYGSDVVPHPGPVTLYMADYGTIKAHLASYQLTTGDQQ